ncbi:triphosphoribosyl-dephospho-CoA synthase [Acidianus brierleyi]|uniref:triphosphoribosyl-dephospho-CoA synthase n=1 Tax=Acidianus brierleyi TaxID=41673 RepID=UPI0013A53040|nr:triphosphoribosyl-dephospho-CoA synthase [Acidianus brierleyi]
MEVTLDLICSEIAGLLSKSSIIESLVFKPGNASRYQDINSVKFRDILESAIISEESYKIACKRGFYSDRPIYDLLYRSIYISKIIDVNFSIFGTEISLLPLAYSSVLAYNLDSLISMSTQVVRSLDRDDSKWFSNSLNELKLSYLGTLSSMDFRNMEETLWNVFMYSSNEDSLIRNIVRNYEYSIEVYNIIRQNPCKDFENNIQTAFIRILSKVPDGLIYRKFGARVALRVSDYASKLPECPSQSDLYEFNKFLVSNKYNPGSTADIIATGLALYNLDKWYEKTRLNIRLPLPRGCDRIYK